MKYFLIFLFSISVNALEITPGSSSASVYFITPLDGESFSDNVTVRFGLENFGVDESSSPELFNSQNEIVEKEDLLSTEISEEGSEDDDLEIPAFLRKQKF
mgnify:CR=1 FL=1